MRIQKTIFSSICIVLSMSCAFAATIQRGNLLIDLDTGKITIVNTNNQYQSLIADSNNTDTTTTSWSSTNTIPPTTTTSEENTASSWSWLIPNIALPLPQAIAWWYENGITKFNSETTFQSDNAILRQEAAKMFMQAVEAFDYEKVIDILPNCTFSDLAWTPADLRGFIDQICIQGIMKWSDGQFRPSGTLTQAEAIALITRLTNRGDLMTASVGTRRQKYRDYVMSNKLIANTSLSYNTINQKISRGDVIMMLHNIAKSQNLIGVSASTGFHSWLVTANTILPSTGAIPTTSTSTISIGKGITDDPEFKTALFWMYQAGMTQYPDPANYNPYDALTREQSAKLLAIYNNKFDTHTTTWTTCALTDIASSLMKDAINAVCVAGIMRGDGKTFRPTATITKVEFMAAMLNMIGESPIVNNTTTRQTATYNKALTLELVSNADLATFDRILTRYEAALLLYKLYVKNRFIASLNNNDVTHTIISSVQQDDMTASWGNQQKVFIDINTIDNKDFTNGFIDIMGTNYALVKKQVSQYFPTSYIRYGDVKTITDDTIIWSISFTIGQQWLSKSIIEWYISLDGGNIFTITPSSQTPYYNITKLR